LATVDRRASRAVLANFARPTFGSLAFEVAGAVVAVDDRLQRANFALAKCGDVGDRGLEFRGRGDAGDRIGAADRDAGRELPERRGERGEVAAKVAAVSGGWAV
jgi:hypothetical protein